MILVYDSCLSYTIESLRIYRLILDTQESQQTSNQISTKSGINKTNPKHYSQNKGLSKSILNYPKISPGQLIFHTPPQARLYTSNNPSLLIIFPNRGLDNPLVKMSVVCSAEDT